MKREKPKFDVGQVVCIRPCTFEKVKHIREGPTGWEYSTGYLNAICWFPEERLRKLTTRESAPRKGKRK